MTNTFFAIQDLYKCVQLDKVVNSIAAENDGEIPDELLEEMVNTQTTSLDSLEELGGFYMYLQARVDTAKKERDRIYEIQKRDERLAERIKDALGAFLAVNGKVTAGTYTFSLRKSEAVSVDDMALLPKDFIKTKIEESADKTAIKQAIKSGQDVPGATIEARMNVQIK